MRGAIDGDLQKPWFAPVLIVRSPLAGLFTGMGVDFDFFETGRYPILDVLRPWYNLPGH